MTIILYENSFISLEDANVYFDERYDSESWISLDDEQKEKLLITATKKINKFDFCGQKADESQKLEFPRDFGTPQDIKDAVCEEAISLAMTQNNLHRTNQQNNISSISLGVGSVSYNTSKKLNEENLLLSETALYLVKKWTKKGYKIG